MSYGMDGWNKEIPGGDSISRAAAIDALSRCQTYLFDTRDTDRKISLEDAEYVIEKLPSAQPERKTGKWTKISPASIYECSVCGQTVMTDDIEAYSYCHGCGVKMEVSEK